MKFKDICKNYDTTIFDSALKSIFIADEELDFEIKIVKKEIIAYVAYKDLDVSNDIYHIFVKEEYRKNSIATELISLIFYKDILVEVDIENIKAINLYKKLGFKKIRELNNYYKNGNDAIVLLNCYNQ